MLCHFIHSDSVKSSDSEFPNFWSVLFLNYRKNILNIAFLKLNIIRVKFCSFFPVFKAFFTIPFI
nr:MAG TPA: hypothetical protein [Caudoviricetes sp.]